MPTKRIYKTKVLTNAERQRRHRQQQKRKQTAALQIAKRVKRGLRVLTMEERAQLASRLASMPKFAVILADPPWEWKSYSAQTGMDRAPPYDTMSTEEICALQPPAAPDCVLFLWRTGPMVEAALQVVRAWGFTFKAEAVWVKRGDDGKLDCATGYWFRGAHEALWVCTRGDVACPAPGEQWESVIEAAAAEHSEKPEAAHAMIEAYFPTTRKLEMFRRGAARPGWSSWGAEAAE